MEFEWTEEQKMLRDATRDFATQRLAPLAQEAEANEAVRPEVMKEIAAMGYCGVGTPEEYGGCGLDTLAYTLVISELSRADASIGVMVSVTNSLVQDPILKFGSEEQKKRFLPPLARGERWGAYALTEPEAGTDAGNTRATALLEGDHYRLNGTKFFVTNGGIAETFLIFASTDRAAGTRGTSAFLVEKGTPGFRLGKKEDKLGIRASSTYELVLEDCLVPRENLLGKPGEGFKIAMVTLDGGRIGIGAQALGIAQRALEVAVQYSKERVQFGKPIATFQAIQFMVADMATDIAAAELLLYRAAWLKDKGQRFSKEAAMAKLFCSEAAHRCVHRSLQIHGGYGYMKEFPIERLYRDQRITEIYEGTSEAMRMVVSASVLR